MIQAEHITKTFHGFKALDDMSLHVPKGTIYGLVGPNGAGKSTLVKLILRFYDASSGQILYNGVDIKEYELSSLRNAFATVFQDYKNFAISVFENVNSEFSHLKECAAEQNVGVSSPEILNVKEDGRSPELVYLEKYLCGEESEPGRSQI